MPDDAKRDELPMTDHASSNGAGPSQWQWLTVGEVAHTIGLTEERVRQLIRERKIKATKIGGWLVRPSDLEAFIRSRTNIPEGS